MSGQDVFTQYAIVRAKACLNMVKPDMDGFPFLDWLGKDSENLFQDIRPGEQKVSTEQILLGAERFIQEEMERFIVKQDAKLVERYTRLNNYFHSRAVHWDAWKKNKKQG